MCTGISPPGSRGEKGRLTVALNGDVGKANQCLAPWAVWNDLKGLDGLVGFFFCTLTRPFQRSADCHGFQYRFQKMAAISLLNRFTDHFRLVGRSVAHGVELVYTEQDSTCVLQFTDPAQASGRTQRRTKLSAPCRSVRVVGDRSSLEIFLNDGAAVFSTRYYPAAGDVAVKISGTDALVYSL